MAYSATLIGGLHSNDYRGLAFLECTEDRNINAKEIYEEFRENQRRNLRGRFDLWLDGGHNDLYFHGFPSYRQYKECFMFKLREKRTHHRFYGFLIHPRPANPRFQACALVSHGRKNEEHTDFTELDRINALRVMPEVTQAVESAFSELE